MEAGPWGWAAFSVRLPRGEAEGAGLLGCGLGGGGLGGAPGTYLGAMLCGGRLGREAGRLSKGSLVPARF